MENILEYDSVSIEYLNKKVIDNVSFNLKSGQILGIVGESGSGKSTIIKSIIGILGKEGKVTDGQIRFENQNLLTKKDNEMRHLRGKKIGMIFQDSASSLCPIRTVGSQMIETMGAHEKINKQRAKEHALKLFERLNFSQPEKLWNSYPFELSGGMNQRVGIALGTVLNPELVLADEPTSALDFKSAGQVVDELKKLNKEFNTSIIIVSHDIGMMAGLCHELVVLKEGIVIEQGAVDEVLNSPKRNYTRKLLAAVPASGGFGWNQL